jgi:negative regulator of flagellin synthesis FlgM
METKTTRGSRMRISTATPNGQAVTRVADSAPVEAAAPAAPAPAAAPLQSAVLQPALAALRAMPDDIDHDKVALLRDALAKGELPFDPAKLAGLIQRFHGSES